jgi:predicted DNA-binding protein with PD1-like motif
LDYSQTTLARVFILRLYSGEVVHDTLETFAIEHNIKSAVCLFLGGADDKSKLVVGPKDGNVLSVEPMTTLLKGVHEGCGVGTIFCDSEDKPKLHMHGSFGRNNNTLTGCMRAGVKIWYIGEIILFELNSSAKREKDLKTGFELLKIP